MPLNDEPVEDDLLTVPLLERPEFHGQIPDDLLEGLSKREIRVLMTLSVMAQQVDWLCKNVCEQNLQLRKMEREQLRLRRFKDMVLNKWSVISAVVLYFAPQVIPKLLAMLK